MATAADALKLVKDSGAAVVDLRFCDLPGLMQHFSMPAHELTEETFRRVSASTARRSADSKRSRSRTCS